ncbi:MAG: sulfatase [Armatimonadetes bacterium]|nr:sulfatase [Armatimonadota bacterium]
MNVILIVSDTFRRDHLGCYGNKWIRTPNIDALAGQACVFENAWTANFPTLPNRYDLMTGRFGFIEYDWSPLPRHATVLQQVLAEAGYVTMLVADTPHIFQHGSNFQRGFDGFWWVRGQENDHYRTSPREVKLPCDPSKLRNPEYTMVHYLRNVARREKEEDYFPAQTMRYAAEWIEENRGERFFLWIDTFDPHEPWDPPQWYVDLYDPGYEGEEVIYPRYGPADYLTPAELKHCRALYAGECSLVDTWVGYLLRRVEELRLLDEIMVIFTTDHGFYIGEHNLTGKSLIWPGGFANCPLYTEVARIPLIIRLPGQQRQRRIRPIVQPPDVTATILDFLNVDIPDTVQGSSLMPLMRGEKNRTRPIAISTPSLAHDPNGGKPTTIVQGQWALVYYGKPDAPLVRHLTSAVDHVERPAMVPLDRVPPPELYDLTTDPGMTNNVINKFPQVAQRLHRAHVRMLESIGMPEDYLQYRRNL